MACVLGGGAGGGVAWAWARDRVRSEKNGEENARRDGDPGMRRDERRVSRDGKFGDTPRRERVESLGSSCVDILSCYIRGREVSSVERGPTLACELRGRGSACAVCNVI